MNRRACACACARSRPVRHPSGGTIGAVHAAAPWLHTPHWYSVAQPAPSGRSTRALRAGRAAQARDSARARERNSERSDRAAPTRSTGRSLAVAWSSPHAEGRSRCLFACGAGTTRSRPLPGGAWPVAGASEWTYGRHAELLAGVPNPPELDPTATRPGLSASATTSSGEESAREVARAHTCDQHARESLRLYTRLCCAQSTCPA